MNLISVIQFHKYFLMLFLTALKLGRGVLKKVIKATGIANLVALCESLFKKVSNTVMSHKITIC